MKITKDYLVAKLERPPKILLTLLLMTWASLSIALASNLEAEITSQTDDEIMQLEGNYDELLSQLRDQGVYIPRKSDDVYKPDVYPVDPIDPWSDEEPTADMVDCSRAVEEFIGKIRSGSPTRESGVTNAEEYLDQFSDTLQNWSEHCLQTDETEYAAEFDDRDLKIESIKTNLGYFYLDGEPRCSGILFSSDIVLSARHCFSPEDPTTPMFRELTECRESQTKCHLEFSTYLNPNLIIRVAGTTQPVLNERTRVFDNEDYIFVKLSSATSSIAVRFQQPAEGDLLFVGGYLPVFENMDFRENVISNEKVYFTPKLYWSENLDGTDQCRVEVVEGNCVYHSCQTLNGFSGSPLIKSASENTITIVGLHIGGAERQSICGASRGSSFNRGISPLWPVRPVFEGAP